MRPKRFTAGDLVELRPPADILATLDAEGRLDGLPFMPEMLAYVGGRYRVSARLERACDTIGSHSTVRRIPDAVLLDDLRCDGVAHDGCQAGCRIYWKEAWLQPAAREAAPRREVSAADLGALTRRVSNVVTGVDDNAPVYRCQATTMVEASVPVTRRESPHSFVEELRSRNVGPVRFVRVVARTLAEGVARRLHLISYGLFMPYDASRRDRGAETPELRPGQLVRIRSKEQIARTLGPNGKNKGLWFDREMLVYCGKTARVLRRIDRFVDERTGKMHELRNDCYVLDGIVCSGDRSTGRRFCPRAIYPFWRACWLEPISELTLSAGPAQPTAPDGSPTSDVAA
jgi:hypothetical protein